MEIKKVAILIGLDYKGTENELPDCQLDVDNIAKNLLVGYDIIEKYYDMSPRQFQGIIEKYASLKSDDTLLICYSGHGTQIPSTLEADRTQEGLVFFQKDTFYVLKDRDFQALLNQLSCNVLVHLDSCFSAGMERMIGDNRISRFKSFHFKDIVVGIRLPRSKKAKKLMLMACSEHETAASTG